MFAKHCNQKPITANVTRSAKRGLIAFSIEYIWPAIVWHVSMVPAWNFGHCTLLTWFYFGEKFYINRLNTILAVTNWSWKLRKAIRHLFAVPVTNCITTTMVKPTKCLTYLHKQYESDNMLHYLDFDHNLYAQPAHSCNYYLSMQPYIHHISKSNSITAWEWTAHAYAVKVTQGGTSWNKLGITEKSAWAMQCMHHKAWKQYHSVIHLSYTTFSQYAVLQVFVMNTVYSC